MIMDSKTSPDLLSAALNQSGLTSCQVEFTDSDGLNIHKNAEAFSNSKNVSRLYYLLMLLTSTVSPPTTTKLIKTGLTV